MSLLPAYQCGMASRIWGQLRNGGRPNCRRFAPLRLWDDLRSQRVREVSSWDPSCPHLQHQEWRLKWSNNNDLQKLINLPLQTKMCKSKLLPILLSSKQTLITFCSSLGNLGNRRRQLWAVWWCYRLPIEPVGDKGWSDLLWPCVVGRGCGQGLSGWPRPHQKRPLSIPILLLCSIPGLYQLRYGLLSL